MSSTSASPSIDGAVGRDAKRARREATGAPPEARTEEQPPAWALALQSLLQAQLQLQAQMQAQAQHMQAQMQAQAQQMQAQIDASRAATQAQI